MPKNVATPSPSIHLQKLFTRRELSPEGSLFHARGRAAEQSKISRAFWTYLRMRNGVARMLANHRSSVSVKQGQQAVRAYGPLGYSTRIVSRTRRTFVGFGVFLGYLSIFVHSVLPRIG